MNLKLADRSQRRPEGFQLLLRRGVGEGATHFTW